MLTPLSGEKEIKNLETKMCTQVNEASSPGTTKGTNTDDIDVVDRVELDMGRLCMNDLYSDVEFLVEEHRLPAHRNILAVRSEYFSAMLYGDMAESKQREIRLNVPVDAFKKILGYIYTGTLPLSKLDVDQILDLLNLVHFFGLQNVEAAIEKNLQQNASLSNICKILNAAHRYSMNDLRKKCLNFMDCKASDVLKHASFAMLCKESLEEVLRRDTFVAPEVEIFQTVCKWNQLNPSADIKTVISHIRLPLMSVSELLHVVRPTGIFELDQILDAIDQVHTRKNLHYRCVKLPGEKWPLKSLTIYSYEHLTTIPKFSLINCINVTVSGGTELGVYVSNDFEVWDDVGVCALESNVPKDIHFTERCVCYISIQILNQKKIENYIIKVIPKYNV
ncbi:BTB/POZ domain-containing protein 9-like [Drosophila miranda]|uniref:BTB/POZ domain-containing protein 9-like n=1 Tax=Drosophila miranda TaxID=7229 RepID=UPI00143F0F0C|nr:BTB/POZ domain-containing protein 9-like [Drosophila miranda]